jgi:ferredoxin--NADP+ reductase
MFSSQEVIWVKHWTPELFSFALSRPDGFKFQSGQFVMINLPEIGGYQPKPRAYSITSPSYAEHLEFLSIVAPDGQLTSNLKDIRPGDHVLVGSKPTGTLVHSALTPGRNLFLFGTGTGIAPWMSIARDLYTYGDDDLGIDRKFDHVYLCHGVRHVVELCYRDYLERDIFDEEILGDIVRDKLHYYPTVTREDFARTGRLTDLIQSGQLFRELGLERTQFDPETDRVMICGNVPVNHAMKDICLAHGLHEGSTHRPGTFVLERAFVDHSVAAASGHH